MSLQSADLGSIASMAPQGYVSRQTWQGLALQQRLPWDIALTQTNANRHILADQEICAEGAEAQFFFRVVAGVVRTCKFFDDGRRQIAAFHVAGEFFGLEPGNEYNLSAEAVTDCTIVCYRRADFEKLISTNAAFGQQFLSIAMHNIAEAQKHSIMLGRKCAAEKVASFLKSWIRNADEHGTVSLAMSRQDIADYLGLTIETVSRTLTQLERDGVIKFVATREIYIRDQAALRKLAA